MSEQKPSGGRFGIAEDGGLRRASLRRQIALMEHVRDTMAAEEGNDFARWTKALMPLTDALLHELAKAEQGPAYVPYPHPMACQWWDAIDLAGVTAEATPEPRETDTTRSESP